MSKLSVSDLAVMFECSISTMRKHVARSGLDFNLEQRSGMKTRVYEREAVLAHLTPILGAPKHPDPVGQRNNTITVRQLSVLLGVTGNRVSNWMRACDAPASLGIERGNNVYNRKQAVDYVKSRMEPTEKRPDLVPPRQVIHTRPYAPKPHLRASDIDRAQPPVIAAMPRRGLPSQNVYRFGRGV